MNLQIIQKLIQAGYQFEEDGSNEVEWNETLVSYVINNAPDIIEKINDDDLDDFLCCDKYSRIYLIKDILSTDVLINYWQNYQDENLSGLYCALYNESYVNESDLQNIDKDILKLFLDNMDDSDPEYYIFKKVYAPEKYFFNQLKDSALDEDEIKEFLNTYLYHNEFTEEICLSKNFQESLNEISEDNNGFFKSTYDTKLDWLWELIDRFGEDVKQSFIEYQYGVDETTFMTEEELEEYNKTEEEKEKERFDEIIKSRSGRISIDCCNYYLQHYTFTKKISVYEGHIGLEDMTFDYVAIDGEQQGEKFMNRPWISGRSFGDNKMSTKWFLDLVDQYKE